MERPGDISALTPRAPPCWWLCCCCLRYRPSPAGCRSRRGSSAWIMNDSHAYSSDAVMILILLHVLGVLLMSVLQRENLVRSMITGWKRRHPVRRDPEPTHDDFMKTAEFQRFRAQRKPSREKRIKQKAGAALIQWERISRFPCGSDLRARREEPGQDDGDGDEGAFREPRSSVSPIAFELEAFHSRKIVLERRKGGAKLVSNIDPDPAQGQAPPARPLPAPTQGVEEGGVSFFLHRLWRIVGRKISIISMHQRGGVWRVSKAKFF